MPEKAKYNLRFDCVPQKLIGLMPVLTFPPRIGAMPTSTFSPLVGVDAYIDPLGTTEFAENFRQNG